MKKIISLLLIFSTLSLFAGNGFTTEFSKTSEKEYTLTFHLGDYSLQNVTLSGQDFTKIKFAGSVTTMQKGWAELPFISTSVQLPDEQDMDFEIIGSDYEEIQLSRPLVPSRGSFSRSDNPRNIPYVVAPESRINEFYPLELVKMEEPFIIRDVRGTTVRVFPFRYNAVTSTLRVYTTVIVRLTANERPATNPLLRENRSEVRTNEALYKSMFINYTPAARANATLTMSEYGDILVLTTAAYESTIAPYVQWKREKGYNVTTKVVPNGALVTDTIKNAYAANPNLMFVQLVGDWANIKSASGSFSSYGSGPTDPYMGCVAGNDNYPDISIGRFSCSSASDLLVQINKSIDYEKTPDMTPGWRETFIGIGSGTEEAQGDDNEYDYEHVTHIYTERLQNFGYQTHKQNYGSSASSATLATHVNAGASTIAYCGHGDVDLWGTTYYNNTCVNNSTNGVKLPFIVSVACLNGAFHKTSDCFAERWLRKENGGAVVTWMSTISQPWEPPQRGQDYFYDMLIGGFNYDNYSGQSGYNTTEQRTHWGSLVVNAACLMLKESSYNDDVYTIKTWTTFGDAALQLRTKTPETLVLSNTSVMAGVPFSGTATVDGNAMANVLICISQNGSYYSGLTDASGNYSINHDFVSDSVLLVATAFNTTTIYQKSLCTSPCTGIDALQAETVDTYDVSLSWEAPVLDEIDESTITGYNVYVNGNFLATTTATSYIHANQLNGTYQYCVTVLYDGEECPVQTCTTATVNDGINHDCSGVSNITGVQNSNGFTLSWDAPAGTVIFDDVEGHNAFTINSPGNVGWSYIDGDNHSTYGFSNYDFTNAGSAMAYIVLNPTQIYHTQNNTPLSDVIPAYSGEQFFASVSSSAGANNDWIISPELDCSSTVTLEFYARGGHNSSYGNESFKVAYSTTGNAQSDFTNVVANVTDVPFSWTRYSYSLPAETKYVGINCTSNNIYYFCLDDIKIEEAADPVEYYVIYCNNVEVGTSTTTSYTLPLGPGDYDFCIETIYDGCSSLPVCTTLNVLDSSEFSNYTITATASSGGTISPAGIITVEEGSDQNFTITPNDGYIIAKVFIDNVDNGPLTTYTFSNITSNHSIYAEFELMEGITDHVNTTFNLYPNPATDVLHLQTDGTGEYELLNFLGQTLMTGNINSPLMELNVKDLAAGIYFVKLKNQQITKKFVKK